MVDDFISHEAPNISKKDEMWIRTGFWQGFIMFDYQAIIIRMIMPSGS
jgi:hypothetical protein